ncbi:MAG: hypothetical protein QM765_06950 [Myxococcales bacterium]
MRVSPGPTSSAAALAPANGPRRSETESVGLGQKRLALVIS